MYSTIYKVKGDLAEADWDKYFGWPGSGMVVIDPTCFPDLGATDSGADAEAYTNQGRLT